MHQFRKISSLNICQLNPSALTHVSTHIIIQTHSMMQDPWSINNLLRIYRNLLRFYLEKMLVTAHHIPQAAKFSDFGTSELEADKGTFLHRERSRRSRRLVGLSIDTSSAAGPYSGDLLDTGVPRQYLQRPFSESPPDRDHRVMAGNASAPRHATGDRCQPHPTAGERAWPPVCRVSGKAGIWNMRWRNWMGVDLISYEQVHKRSQTYRVLAAETERYKDKRRRQRKGQT